MVEFLRSDLEFILDQIFIAEAHARGEPLDGVVADPTLPFGLRTVDGTYNNLVPGQNGFGAADRTFPRMLDLDFRDVEDLPDLDGPGPMQSGPTSYAQLRVSSRLTAPHHQQPHRGPDSRQPGSRRGGG